MTFNFVIRYFFPWKLHIYSATIFSNSIALCCQKTHTLSLYYGIWCCFCSCKFFSLLLLLFVLFITEQNAVQCACCIWQIVLCCRVFSLLFCCWCFCYSFQALEIYLGLLSVALNQISIALANDLKHYMNWIVLFAQFCSFDVFVFTLYRVLNLKCTYWKWKLKVESNKRRMWGRKLSVSVS